MDEMYFVIKASISVFFMLGLAALFFAQLFKRSNDEINQQFSRSDSSGLKPATSPEAEMVVGQPAVNGQPGRNFAENNTGRKADVI